MSDDVAKKFVSRAPRFYVESDESLQLKVHTDPSDKKFHLSEVHNLSTTGLAFMSEPHWTPFISEVIELHINLQSDEKVTWQAKVMRLVEVERPTAKLSQKGSFLSRVKTNSSSIKIIDRPIYVGVHFINMSEDQIFIIKKWIKKHHQERRNKYIQAVLKNTIHWLRQYGKPILIIGSFSLVVGMLLYWLMQPSDNYDKNIGAPWGHRFKLFDFNPLKK